MLEHVKDEKQSLKLTVINVGEGLQFHEECEGSVAIDDESLHVQSDDKIQVNVDNQLDSQ